MRVFVVISVVWSSMLLSSLPVQADPWTESKTDRAITLAKNYLNPPGAHIRPSAMSIAIGVEGKLVFSTGVGPVGFGRMADADTMYRVGSITKQFVAAAVLSMIEEQAVSPLTGKPITLATHVDEILEGSDAWTVRGQPPITMRRLLNMTSNLPNFTRRPPEATDPWGSVEAKQLLQELKKLKPSGWPDTYEYSNTSYFILAAVLEAAVWPDGSQRRYEDILRQDVFAPAQMTRSSFTGQKVTQIALPTFRGRPAFTGKDWLKGSGDATSSAIEVFAWNKALMQGKVLSSNMRTEMFNEGARVTPTVYYGMGWFITEDDGWQQYYHSGQVPGFTAMNVIAHRLGDPASWVSVTLLTNADGIDGLEQLADDYVFLATRKLD